MEVTSVTKKRLSKYSTAQLFAKVEKGSLSEEESKVALDIIESRTGGTKPDSVVVQEQTKEELTSNQLEDGDITVEEITAAIDFVYASEDTTFIKGMMSLFPEEFDDYSDLTQEQRKAIIDYSHSRDKVKETKPSKSAKTTKEPKLPKIVKTAEQVVDTTSESGEQKAPKTPKSKVAEFDHPTFKVGDKVSFIVSEKHKEFGGKTLVGLIKRIWCPNRQPDPYVRIRTEFGIFDKRDHALTKIS